MNILFLHRSFPAQFKYIAPELAKGKSNRVVFITNVEHYEIEGVEKHVYQPILEGETQDSYLAGYASAIAHGKGAAKVASKLKEEGFVPDVIYGHSGWGVTMFMKDVFPDVPLLCYFEWFANADGADTGFDGVKLAQEQREGLRCANSQILIDLYSCDGGISPTIWQKNQFPKDFQNKIKVIPDGVETDFYKPDANTKFIIQDKELELSRNDEVITYATRGMEPYRGFPEFMQAVEKLLKKRPNAHFVIAGHDKICYRGRLENETYKEKMLRELDIDLSRVHFVGGLSYVDYAKLLQVSSVHVYLTVPYVLSWSFLDAMSTGCCIVASKTQPVCEVMKDNYNGLLFNFYDINEQVEKIEYALVNKNETNNIREAARRTILDNYALKDILPMHIQNIKNMIE